MWRGGLELIVLLPNNKLSSRLTRDEPSNLDNRYSRGRSAAAPGSA